MKLTTKQLRQMIIEELNEMYRGKNRTFYAPGPIKMDDEEQKRINPQYRDKLKYKIPQETGAYALPSGDPYDQLDPILEAYIEQDMGINSLTEAGFEAQLVEHVINAVEISEYKRRQSPPGVKITPRSFDKDRRMPIVNKYRN